MVMFGVYELLSEGAVRGTVEAGWKAAGSRNASFVRMCLIKLIVNRNNHKLDLGYFSFDFDKLAGFLSVMLPISVRCTSNFALTLFP